MGTGALACQNFWDPLHARTQYEKSEIVHNDQTVLEANFTGSTLHATFPGQHFFCEANAC